MKKTLFCSLSAALMLCALGLSSCHSMKHSQHAQQLEQKVEEPQEAQKSASELAKTSYEKFITSRAYPNVMDAYMDDALLKQAGGNSVVYICLSQQRGRLYVNGKLAMDWPVSTGTSGHATPSGNFRILEKDEKHVSTSYGRLYNAKGSCINSNATPAMPVPEGGRFEGSPMPYFMRITWDGVGMHTGRVRAGTRLSHGCIRTPNRIASCLFNITQVGTRVNVVQAVESCYPASTLLQQHRAELKAKEAKRKAKEAERKAKEAERKAMEEALAKKKASSFFSQKQSATLKKEEAAQTPAA